MPGLRAHSAYDSNPSFVLDFVYNIVFNLLDLSTSQTCSRQCSSAVRSLFLDEESRC